MRLCTERKRNRTPTNLYTIKWNMCEWMSINGLSSPNEYNHARQSQTLETDTLVYSNIVMLMDLHRKKNILHTHMNNLENGKLDEMKLAIWARNIGQPNTSAGFCKRIEDQKATKPQNTSAITEHLPERIFWCFEWNEIAFSIILFSVIAITSHEFAHFIDGDRIRLESAHIFTRTNASISMQCTCGTGGGATASARKR